METSSAKTFKAAKQLTSKRDGLVIIDQYQKGDKAMGTSMRIKLICKLLWLDRKEKAFYIISSSSIISCRRWKANFRKETIALIEFFFVR
jgi:hypothetical protein